jgi:hypothetical protein
VSRHLLNDVPDWALALIFVAAAVAFTFAALGLLHRFAPQWRDAESSDKVVGVAAMVMTLFALVLAFVIVNLYSGYESASSDVGAEANSLSEVVLDVHSFPARQRRLMDAAVARYVRELRAREFALLRDGRADPEAQAYLDRAFDTLGQYTPSTAAQMSFYRVTADDLDKVATQRNNRIDAAEASIPSPLLGLLVMLAVLTLLTTVLVRTRHFGLDLILALSIAASVGAGVVTAALLEYPFSGSIAVSSEPFARADLAQLLRANP